MLNPLSKEFTTMYNVLCTMCEYYSMYLLFIYHMLCPFYYVKCFYVFVFINMRMLRIKNRYLRNCDLICFKEKHTPLI